MSGIPNDFNAALYDQLMLRLENGMLGREEARELIPLVIAKLDIARDPELKDDLSLLIDVLNSYISGRINLLRPPDVNRVSNIR